LRYLQPALCLHEAGFLLGLSGAILPVAVRWLRGEAVFCCSSCRSFWRFEFPFFEAGVFSARQKNLQDLNQIRALLGASRSFWVCEERGIHSANELPVRNGFRAS
jgi:hypothetical protein